MGNIVELLDRKAGFDIKSFDFFHHQHTKSVRPDIFVFIVRAGR